MGGLWRIMIDYNVRCAACGKRARHHEYVTQKCPRGQYSRKTGYAGYGPGKFTTEKR